MCFRSSVWAGGDVIHERRRAAVEWWASWTEQGGELAYYGSSHSLADQGDLGIAGEPGALVVPG
jgi:hypothetical protein